MTTTETIRAVVVLPNGSKALLAFKEEQHPRWPDGRFKDKGAFTATKNWLGSTMRKSGIQRKGHSKTPVVMLDAISDRDSKRYDAPDLGRFLIPDLYGQGKLSQQAGIPVVADNGGYNEFNPEKSPKKRAAIHANWLKMVHDLHDQGVKPLWVTVPDVLRWPDGGGPPVGDADATIKRWPEGKKTLDDLGLPAAFVAQDGMDTPENLAWLDKHWDEIDAIFIGGSDEFKLGPSGYKIAKLAHDHGKLVHVGRVNSAMRVAYVRDVMQADSYDGKNWAQFKALKLADGLEFSASGDAPPLALGQRWIREAIKARDEGGPWPKPPGRHRPQWHGYFPRMVGQAAEPPEDGGVLYYEPLADALYAVGLSDYRNLDFEPGEPGFVVEVDESEQVGWLIDILGLPEPQRDGDRVTWPRITIVPDGPVEDETAESAVAMFAFDKDQPRVPGGQPGGGRWLSLHAADASIVEDAKVRKALETEHFKDGSVQVLGSGISSTFIGDLDDGTPAMIKERYDPAESSYGQLRENLDAGLGLEHAQASARIANYLGVETPQVAIRDADESKAAKASGAYDPDVYYSDGEPSGEAVNPDKDIEVQEWWDDATKPASERHPFPREQAERFAVLDAIIGNTDRHAGNWAVHDDKLAAIDMDLTFPTGGTHGTFMRWIDTHGKSLSGQKLSPQTKKLLDDMGRNARAWDRNLRDDGLSREEISQMWERVNAIRDKGKVPEPTALWLTGGRSFPVPMRYEAA